MATIQHDYIFATTCREGLQKEFSDFLYELVQSGDFREPINCIFHTHKSPANSFYTLIMFPDGWNEGGLGSTSYDLMRKRFLEWLKMQQLHPIIVSTGELGTTFKC